MIAFESGAVGTGALLLLSGTAGAPGSARGPLLGLAAGLLLAVSNISLEALTATVPGDPLSIVSPWTLALALAGVGAFFALARGFQTGGAISVTALASVAANCVSIGGALTIFEEIPPLLDTPLHMHSKEDELFYILEGEHVVQRGETEFRVGPGDTVFLPRGVPHAQRRVVPREGRPLVVCAPAGFEDFFRDLAAAEGEGRLGPDAYAAASAKAGLNLALTDVAPSREMQQLRFSVKLHAVERQRISSGSPWEDTVGFSRAVRMGDRVLVAGTAPIWPDGSCDPDPEVQARRCIEIIIAALAEAGAGPEHVVRTRMFIIDAEDAEAVGRAHGTAFGEARPASTSVIVAGLVDPRWKVEMEAEAIVD
jgi:enamine deaminase RidA (YjgF/YER057c/UK114 family)/mannose-6-phosphate isomerase-like protein (cupin superfamily)